MYADRAVSEWSPNQTQFSKFLKIMKRNDFRTHSATHSAKKIRLRTIAAFLSFLGLALTFSFGVTSSLSAQEGTLLLPGNSKTEHLISTVLTPEGIRILKVGYPCSLHPSASLEIRPISEKAKKKPEDINPVFFQSRWLERNDQFGDLPKDALSDCYLGDEDDFLMKTLHFEDPTVTMNVLGWVSVLGRRETVVRFRLENRETKETDTTLIFPHASRFQVSAAPTKKDPFSSCAFGFELPGPEFDQPCDLMVWVLRGEKIMHQEVVHWEGRLEKPYEEKEVQVRRSSRSKKAEKEKDDFFDDEEEDEEFFDEEEDEEEFDEGSEDGSEDDFEDDETDEDLEEDPDAGSDEDEEIFDDEE